MQSKVLEGIFRKKLTNTSGDDLVGLSPLEVFASLVRAKESAQATGSTAAGTSHRESLTSQSDAFDALVPPFGAASTASQRAPQNAIPGLSGSASQASELFGTLSKSLESLRLSNEAQTAVVSANTQAVTSNTTAKAASQAFSSISNAAGGFLGGLTALPIISGIAKLFGGGNPAPVPAITKYAAPTPINFESITQNEGGSQTVGTAGYNRYGMLRATSPSAIPSYSSFLASAANSSAVAPVNDGPVSGTSTSRQDNTNSSLNSSGPATQVTVNVQAMDSRSFLDRSHDIAQAVREAMLNMHPINDVVNDL